MIDVPRTLEALGIEYRDRWSELWACCPHPGHNELEPSWSIRNEPGGPSHALHKCFGCGWGGGALELVATTIGITYSGARTWLEERGLLLSGVVALEVEIVNRSPRLPRLKIPGGLAHGPLDRWVTPARRYMQRRGITAEQVERWGICYATDGKLAGRIVFPLRDAAGIWRSYHARSYAGHSRRYKNASSADGYDPGAVFGEERWPSLEVQARSSVVLTEGTIDALAFERVGAQYLAAIGGSEPHARQFLKLSGWGTVQIGTDGDAAGEKVARAIAHGLGYRLEVQRLAVPPKEDAASLPPEVRRALLV